MTDHIKIIICPFCQKQQNHCCDNNHSRNNEPCRIDPYDTFIFLLPAIGIDVIIIFYLCSGFYYIHTADLMTGICVCRR